MFSFLLLPHSFVLFMVENFKQKNLNDMKVIQEIDFDKESGKLTSHAIPPDFMTTHIAAQILFRNFEGQRKSEAKKFKLQNQSKMENYQNMKFLQMVNTLWFFYQLSSSNSNSSQDFRWCHMITAINKIWKEEKYQIRKQLFYEDYKMVVLYQCHGDMSNKLTEDYHDIWFENNSIFAFSLNQQSLVFSNSGENEKNIIWNLNKERIAKKLKGHVNRVSASLDGKLIIWNFITGEKLQVLDQNGFEIKNLSISHDKSMMVSTDNFGTFYLWSSIAVDSSKLQNITSSLAERLQKSNLLKEILYSFLVHRQFLKQKLNSNQSNQIRKSFFKISIKCKNNHKEISLLIANGSEKNEKLQIGKN